MANDVMSLSDNLAHLDKLFLKLLNQWQSVDNSSSQKVVNLDE